MIISILKTSFEGVAAFVKGYNQGCADPDPDPCFFAQKDPDPDPLKLTDPYGSGSVPRIRKILMKIRGSFGGGDPLIIHLHTRTYN